MKRSVLGLAALVLLISTLGEVRADYIITNLGVGNGTGISDNGQVVGSSGGYAFLYSNGVMTNLGTLPGTDYSSAMGVNDSGQVVGYSLAGGEAHAFLYSNGVMTALPTLPGANVPGGANENLAYGINNSGQVVGWSITTDGATAQQLQMDNPPMHPFLYSNGVMTDLTPSTSQSSYATAVNASGQVVGYSNGQVFLYSHGSLTDLGYGTASGINDSGEIVGWSGSSPYAFLYSNGVMSNLGTLPGNNASQAIGINNNGQVVGQSYTQGSILQGHAFLYSNGVMTDLNTFLPANANYFLYDAAAINNNGQIVADGSNGDVYLLTPEVSSVPEPSTLTLLGIGAVCLVGHGWRRRRKCA